MHILPFLLKELEQEAKTTRKFLKLVDPEKFSWKPHEKSMDMKRLSVHIAELPSWIDLAVNTDGINFANGYKSPEVNNSQDLLETWTIRNGDTILNAMSKYEAIRHSFSQTIHHRAQLGVFLRLQNIPIPGSYGPSADDPVF